MPVANRNLGMLLLAIYLILVGISSFVPFPLPIHGLVALLAGIFILMGR
jgi:hypothetical protein